MPLKGSIDEFSLLDIFRLVGWAKKTGQLIVTSHDKEGGISFDKGLVCFAKTPHNRIAIGSRLINARLVSKQELEEALQIQHDKEPPEKLGEILIKQNLIKQDELEEFLQEQIQDALFEILYWTNGYYHFQSSEDLGQENFGISFAVEYVIDKVEKRKVEWEKIKETIPSTQLWVKISDNPGKEKQEIVLTPQEWRILYVLNQERSITQLRDKSQLTLFKLCKTLKNMLTKNLVELMDKPENYQEEMEPQEKEAQKPEEIEEQEKPKEQEEREEEDETEETPLEVVKEDARKELQKDQKQILGGGKYITDFPEEIAEETVGDRALPLEWTRYLKSPRRSPCK